MSWSEVKKINSDMSKPLDKLIEETNENYKIHYMTASAVGVPYNQKYQEKVITDETAPLISVTGKGKILSIFPLFESNDMVAVGTAQVKIDGKEVIHKSISFGSSNSGYAGSAILLSNAVATYDSKYVVRTDTFNMLSYHYFDIRDVREINNVLNENIFNTNISSSYYQDGLYFYDRFEVRATQAKSSNVAGELGIYVMYELFE